MRLAAGLVIAFLAVGPALASSEPPPERDSHPMERTEILARHRRVFPPCAGVLDLLVESAAAGTGQLDLLFNSIAERKPKRVVVESVGSWCLPCRKQYPALCEAARKAGPTDTLFAILAFEPDETDYEGLLVFARTYWNGGLELAWPHYAVLGSCGGPLRDRMDSVLPLALAREAVPEGASLPPASVSSGLLPVLKFLEGKGVTVAGNTAGEVADQLGQQTGLIVLMPASLRGTRFGMAGERIAAGGVVETLVNILGCRVITLPPESGIPPVLEMLESGQPDTHPATSESSVSEKHTIK